MTQHHITLFFFLSTPDGQVHEWNKSEFGINQGWGIAKLHDRIKQARRLRIPYKEVIIMIDYGFQAAEGEKKGHQVMNR